MRFFREEVGHWMRTEPHRRGLESRVERGKERKRRQYGSSREGVYYGGHRVLFHAGLDRTGQESEVYRWSAALIAVT